MNSAIYEKVIIEKKYRMLSDKELSKLLLQKPSAQRVKKIMHDLQLQRTDAERKAIRKRTHPAAFQDGNAGGRWRPIGTVQKCSDGYWYIKTENGRVPYHRYLWEQEKGDVPEGMVVAFKNRIRKLENLRVDHLEIIPRAELARRNYKPQKHGKSKRRWWRMWREMKKQLLDEQVEKINSLLEKQRSIEELVQDYYLFKKRDPSLKKTIETVRNEEKLKEIKKELQDLLIEYYKHLPARSIDESFKKYPKF